MVAAIIGGGVTLIAILGVVKKVFGDGKNTKSKYRSNIVIPDGINDEFLSELNSKCGTNYEKTIDERCAYDNDLTLEQIADVDKKLNEYANQQSDGNAKKQYDFGKTARFTKYITYSCIILAVITFTIIKLS